VNIVLLRVGVDAGCGRIQGPLFANGDFEFITIPDDRMLDSRTYGNTKGRSGRPLVDFFPTRRQPRMANQPMHVDPEFATFTYGDPTTPKRVLLRLRPGDLLVFYAGLEGFEFVNPPALYLVGYFEVAKAGLASSFTAAEIATLFSQNFHVRHASLFALQYRELVLVKGGAGSRLYNKAHLLSITVTPPAQPPLKIISPAMRSVFGHFGKKYSFQRSPPRWVEPAYVSTAASFVRGLV
jgi:Nucleotide modification associated domain 3